MRLKRTGLKLLQHLKGRMAYAYPPLADLPPNEKVQVVLSVIRARTQHDLIVAAALLIMAVILAMVALLWRPGMPVPPDVASKLVGKYQVHLGPKGGCNSGPANSYPTNLAEISTNGSDLSATNECGTSSPWVRISADGKTLFFFGESAQLRFTGGDGVEIDADDGNSWQKVKK